MFKTHDSGKVNVFDSVLYFMAFEGVLINTS